MRPVMNALLCFGLLLSGICQQNVKSFPLNQGLGTQSLDLEIAGIQQDLEEEDGIDIDQISAMTNSPLQFAEMYSQMSDMFPVIDLDEMRHENQTYDIVTSESFLESVNADSSSDTSLENVNKSDVAFTSGNDISTTEVLRTSAMEMTTGTMVQLQDDKQMKEASSVVAPEATSSKSPSLESEATASVNISTALPSVHVTDQFENHQGTGVENVTSSLYDQFSEETDNEQSSEDANPLDGSLVDADEYDKEYEAIQDDDFDADQLPIALQNLPHDIPKDRTIAEVLAENTIKDKQFDELRIKELIHELMTHTLGFGEVYSDEPDYEVKDI